MTFAAGISLVILVAVILISYFKKINVGLVALLGAFILGLFVTEVNSNGVAIALSSPAAKAKTLIGGFNYSLWFTIMAVSIFFSISQIDGTMELVTKRLVMLTRGKTRIIPIVFFILSTLVGALGAGSYGVLLIFMPLATSVAMEEGISFILMGIAVAVGAAVGTCSPLGTAGIAIGNYTSGMALEAPLGWNLWIRFLICATITYVLFFVLFGGLKIKNKGYGERQACEAFSGRQKITLTAILVFVILALIVKVEVGFAAIICAVVVAFINKVDEKKIFAMIPWSTLILVAGMGILINVVKMAGGIDLLTTQLTKLMTPLTAAPIISLMAGIMSSVSSAVGVVIPTLVPTVEGIAAATGTGPAHLVRAIAFGAHQTGVSPLSSAGALVLAFGGDNIDANKTFKQLFIVAGYQMLLALIYSAVGIM